MFNQKLKNLLPRKLITSIRFFSIFNNGFGHSSRKNGFCINGKGEPIPWITYSCLEYISRLDFSELNIFEFGSGSSTLWWASRAKTVHAVEREEDWFNLVKPQLPSHVNIELCKNEAHYSDCISNKQMKFDVIIIDGAVRYPCVESSLLKINEDGIIILDNSEWYPNASKLLRENGFIQVDFSGFGPINAFTSCTSIFFRGTKVLSRRLNHKDWHPIGGRFLMAHDDVTFKEISRDTLRLVD